VRRFRRTWTFGLDKCRRPPGISELKLDGKALWRTVDPRGKIADHDHVVRHQGGRRRCRPLKTILTGRPGSDDGNRRPTSKQRRIPGCTGASAHASLQVLQTPARPSTVDSKIRDRSEFVISNAHAAGLPAQGSSTTVHKNSFRVHCLWVKWHPARSRARSDRSGKWGCAECQLGGGGLGSGQSAPW
jgi:hypothetical protein